MYTKENAIKNLLTTIVVAIMLMSMGAVAQAVPVKLLPAPTAADVACDNLIDEAQLLKELQAWQKNYNALLRSMEELPEKKLYRVMVETIWAKPTQDLNAGQMEALLDAVLSRVEDNKSTPQDKRLISVLKRYGIEAGSTDGCPWLSADIVFFRECFTVPPTAAAFIALLQAQPNKYTYDEGWREHSCEDVAKWLIQWEQLIQSNPAQPWLEAAKVRYFYLLNLLLFHKDHDLNMPAREDADSVRYWREALQQGITAHPDTLSAALFKEALAATDNKTCIVTRAVKQRILAQAKVGLAGTKDKAGAQKP